MDIDPGVADRLAGKFPNVDYRLGDSAVILSELIAGINESDRHVEFILIDGDHSTDGVRRDIEAVLALRPRGRVVVIIHDSFNPGCREGMRMARWAECPHVHYVELDFIPGIYHYEAYDTAEARSMCGGFACAVLEAQPRTGNLTVRESQRMMFEAVYESSRHMPFVKRSLRSRVLGRVKRMLG